MRQRHSQCSTNGADGLVAIAADGLACFNGPHHLVALFGRNFAHLPIDQQTSQLCHFLLSGIRFPHPPAAKYLPVFYKQRDFNFYPPWAYALASYVAHIPEELGVATLQGMIVYWMVDLSHDVSRWVDTSGGSLCQLFVHLPMHPLMLKSVRAAMCKPLDYAHSGVPSVRCASPQVHTHTHDLSCLATSLGLSCGLSKKGLASSCRNASAA